MKDFVTGNTVAGWGDGEREEGEERDNRRMKAD